MKTAVEFMASELLYLDNEYDMKLINKNEYQAKRKEIIKQAKEMEKERVIDFAKKFSDFNGLTFNEKEVSKEYLEKLYSNQNQMKIIKTKKCDWCNKRKNIDNGYYIGKLESSKTDKEFFICVDCNLKHNIV
jgi:site-specific DNA-adenine methylase